MPLRREYADAVYLVTSGEFMSLYAANNILRGVRNFDREVPRVAGLILNCRGMEGEEDIVRRFADAVSLPVITSIPRSKLFADAEASGHTLLELFPDSGPAKDILRLAKDVVRKSDGRESLRKAMPLDDDQMCQLAAGKAITPSHGGMPPANVVRGCWKGGTEGRITTADRVIHSCAANGAVYGFTRVTDAVTIVHGPRSCAHIMTAAYEHNSLRHWRNSPGKERIPISRRLYCTDVDDTVSVFGGTGPLERLIRERVLEGNRHIFVVTTCVSGIIGDNTSELARDLEREYPGVSIKVVEADGNISGEWDQGFLASIEAMTELVDRDVEAQEDTVNILAERHFFKRMVTRDERQLQEMFDHFGLRINCRFMSESDLGSIKGLKKGKLNFMAVNDPTTRDVAEILHSRLGIEIFPIALPVGMGEFREWATALGMELGEESLAEELVHRTEREYSEAMERLIPSLSGRRAIVINKFSNNIDWLLELLMDMEVEIVKVGVGPVHHWRSSDPDSRFVNLEFQSNYQMGDLVKDVQDLSPDLVLGDGMMTTEADTRYDQYIRPEVGTRSTIEYARRIADLIKLPKDEGWRAVG